MRQVDELNLEVWGEPGQEKGRRGGKKKERGAYCHQSQWEWPWERWLKGAANLGTKSPLIFFDHLLPNCSSWEQRSSQWLGFSFHLFGLSVFVGGGLETKILLIWCWPSTPDLFLASVPLCPTGSYLINIPSEVLRSSLRTLKLNSIYATFAESLLCAPFCPGHPVIEPWTSGMLSHTWLFPSLFGHNKRVSFFVWALCQSLSFCCTAWSLSTDNLTLHRQGSKMKTVCLLGIRSSPPALDSYLEFWVGN